MTDYAAILNRVDRRSQYGRLALLVLSLVAWTWAMQRGYPEGVYSREDFRWQLDKWERR